MAESMEHMERKLLIFREIRDALAGRPPRDPSNAPIHRFMTRELEYIPALKHMLQELIEHPWLLMSDVRAYRAHVRKNGHCFDDPKLQEQPKCSVRSAEIRRIGNAVYALRDYAGALEKYNESICFAPNDSEDLGIGYANRSAVFYETGEYRLALANIALAKKNNYPERLMPKLLTRETSCCQIIEEYSHHKNAVRFPSLAFNVEVNPRIPFLAKGILSRELPVFGTSMLADKSFKVGDVILREKPLKVSTSANNRYFSCNRCLAENMFHLIPCPNCSSAMFCGEECMTEGQKTHRFECGVTAELSCFNDFWTGSRMFFHGLTLFGDDVQKMMDFCNANKESGLDFIDLDYSNYDPLEEFKAFLGPPSSSIVLKPLFDCIAQFTAAIIYHMVMKVPLVRSLMTGKKQRDFMLQCFLDFMNLTDRMSVNQEVDGQLYPIASYFGHSTDPNTVTVDAGGELKLIVLRPIRRGERILISYSPRYEREVSERHARYRALGLNCQCRICDQRKSQRWLAKVPKGKTIAPAHWETVKRVLADGDFNNADKLNALQQFIQRYADLHPQEDLSTILAAYRFLLDLSHENEMKAALRKKV